MSTKDNSVNMENEPRRYHHGDLRAALVEAGLDLLRDRSADDLSLREVARAVGVSATAVYRHFPDKQSLVFALCTRGADALAEAQMQAITHAETGLSPFDASGQAYVRFALANPGLFRLMMTTRPPEGVTYRDESVVTAAKQLLIKNVSAMMPASATDDEKWIAAIHAWAKVHGMAMLMLDGQIPAEESIINTLRYSPETRIKC